MIGRARHTCRLLSREVAPAAFLLARNRIWSTTELDDLRSFPNKVQYDVAKFWIVHKAVGGLQFVRRERENFCHVVGCIPLRECAGFNVVGK